MLKKILAVVLIISFSQKAIAAEKLTPNEQHSIILELQVLIQDNYVLEDRVELLTEGLSQALSSGVFEKPLAIEDFVALTNRTLQNSAPDRHLGLLPPERFAKMMELFGDLPADFDHGSGTPEVQSYGGHAPEGHAPASHAPAGHAPPRNSTSDNREQKGMNQLREIAGITRVAEINRDGLNQIGYIAFERLINNDNSRAIIENIFRTFTESDRIIIDLRDCGGGDVEIVKILSNFFYDKPTHLVSSMVKGGKVTERWTTPNELSSVFSDKKLDVLISKKSFSAAESFAFGMKQTGRARLIGQATGGGGHMNDFFPLPHGFGASISIGRTYDPRTGEGWEATGVLPNLIVEKDHALSEATFLITEESGRLSAFSKSEAGIYRALQIYAQAWYRADAKQMKRAIAKDFEAEYASLGEIVGRNYKEQLSATKAGQGRLPPLFHNRIITDIEVSGSEATARLILRTTSHDVRLIRVDSGDWKILRDDHKDKSRHG